MSSMRRTGWLPGSGSFLSVLLIGVLLLCHGVFGALHLVHPCDPAEAPGTHHSAAQHSGDGPTDGLIGCSGYFTVVLTLFGAALLGLLLGGIRKTAEVRALRPYRPRYSPVLIFLPRGPSPPLLQVFRL